MCAALNMIESKATRKSVRQGGSWRCFFRPVSCFYDVLRSPHTQNDHGNTRSHTYRDTHKKWIRFHNFAHPHVHSNALRSGGCLTHPSPEQFCWERSSNAHVGNVWLQKQARQFVERTVGSLLGCWGQDHRHQHHHCLPLFNLDRLHRTLLKSVSRMFSWVALRFFFPIHFLRAMKNWARYCTKQNKIRLRTK